MLEPSLAGMLQRILDRSDNISVIPGIGKMLHGRAVQTVGVDLSVWAGDMNIQGYLAIGDAPQGVIIFVFAAAAVRKVPSEEPDTMFIRLVDDTGFRRNGVLVWSGFSI